MTAQASAEAIVPVLLQLLSPEEQLRSDGAAGALFRDGGWQALCGLAHRHNIAARLYTSLRAHAQILPADVRVWFEMQCVHTASRNHALADVLDEIVSAFRDSSIPVLAFKGPVLACAGSGLHIRWFRDLDILVHRPDMPRAAAVLGRMGFFELVGIAPAPYHHVYIRTQVGGGTVVELHVDLYDRDRGIRPDIAGLWDRVTETDIDGRRIPAPEITDHLLLTIMQLPHHGWRPGLFVDVADTMWRQQNLIRWDEAVQRARRWGMRSLSGAVLDAAQRLLGVPLPTPARLAAQPQGISQRTQWRLVREAFYEQLAGGRGRVCRAASWLVRDQLRGEALFGARDREASERRANGETTAVPRRLARGASSLHSVIRALVRPEPAGPRHLRDGPGSRA